MEDKVQLYVYDLSQGMARQLSPMLLGQQIDGIWHTAVVVRGLEYFYGQGIQISRAGTTPFGVAVQVLDLGTTSIPTDIIDELLMDLGNGQFRAQDYNLIYNNCNHFSHQLSQLLTGQGIPDHIVLQGERVLNSPMGQMLRPMLMQMEGQLGNMTAGAGAAGAMPTPAGGASQPASSPIPPTATATPPAATTISPAATAIPFATAAPVPTASVPQAATLVSSVTVVSHPPPVVVIASASGASLSEVSPPSTEFDALVITTGTHAATSVVGGEASCAAGVAAMETDGSGAAQPQE
ncbi:MAG: hypothetical protein WDW38_002347 [Sanguina aurantia]